MITIRISIKELFWILPFAAIGLMTLALFRPAPVFTLPENARIIKDASGNEVAIPQPFKGFVPGAYLYDVLQKTRRPEALAKGGGPGDRPGLNWGLMHWIYPSLSSRENLWDFPGDLESILAKDQGYVYIGFGGVDRFGLAAPSIYPPTPEADKVMFAMARVLNDIAGQPGQAEIIIESFQQELAWVWKQVEMELLGLPAGLHRPRALSLVCPDGEWTRLWGGGLADARLGLADISEGLVTAGRDSDAERILAMNPDFILLRVGSAEYFMKDPRWQGLEAVKQRRVYTNITTLNGYTYDLDNIPGACRWLAELIRPDVLRPRLRQILRDHYLDNYNFHLGDFEIDFLLKLDENKASQGYSRFARQGE